MTFSEFEPPMDHIFGDMDDPKNTSAWLIARHQGVHHYNIKFPANPTPGGEVCLKVTCSVDQPVESVHLWYTTDEWAQQEERQFAKAKLVWRTDLWSYLQEWEITLPVQPAGTMLRYKIAARLQGSLQMAFADNQARTFEKGTHFSIYYGESSPPKWVEDAIVYQIFVDRFKPAGEDPWIESGDLCKAFGGSLQGVTEKLPYIKAMGFNAIWLTPIFVSPSHHGYDSSDYYKIKPKFGTMDDFLELIDTAHFLQIRVILDFVANHCSNEHSFFKDAVNNHNSQYHDYFVWKDWPNYESFYNVRSMPKVNLAYGSPAREYMLNCAKYWLEKGVDGFRLDYAHGPEQDFWIDFRHVCETVNPDCWTFGEVVQPADIQASFAGGLMGTLDFVLCQALRSTFAQGKWSLAKFAAFLQAHFSYFSKSFNLPAFLDNHDMNRFIYAANHNEKLLKLALLVLYVLPGPPILYNGTEIPLSQRRSIHARDAQGFDEARLPMTWDLEKSFQFTEYLARLAEIRQKYPQLRQAEWTVNAFDEKKDMLVLSLGDSQDFMLLINRSPKEHQLLIQNPEYLSYQDLVDHTTYPNRNDELQINLPAQTGILLSAKNCTG
jgi:cyclomaltodextrinase